MSKTKKSDPFDFAEHARQLDEIENPVKIATRNSLRDRLALVDDLLSRIGGLPRTKSKIIVRGGLVLGIDRGEEGESLLVKEIGIVNKKTLLHRLEAWDFIRELTSDLSETVSDRNGHYSAQKWLNSRSSHLS